MISTSGRRGQPSAVLLAARMVQSTPASGAGAGSGYDGHKRRHGRKVQVAVDPSGQLLATVIPPANDQDRAQVAELAALAQDVTGQTVELAGAEQADTGDEPAEAAAAHGLQVAVVTLPDAARRRRAQARLRLAAMALPRRWVVERRFAWLARFRRLAREYERLPQTVTGLTLLAFTCLSDVASVDPPALKVITGARMWHVDS